MGPRDPRRSKHPTPRCPHGRVCTGGGSLNTARVCSGGLREQRLDGVQARRAVLVLARFISPSGKPARRPRLEAGRDGREALAMMGVMVYCTCSATPLAVDAALSAWQAAQAQLPPPPEKNV